MSVEAIRLTELSHGAGCACKLPAGALAEVLAELPVPGSPDLLVGHGGFDDAAVWRVSPELAIVQTIDFFTPVVDDPYDFGRIAATNALSDVYAMGGRPAFCLNVVAFPKALPIELLGEILRGGGDAAAAAGAVVAGGHSIDDPEPKFGLVAVGEVDPRRMTTNDAARPGDRLVLTKAIGTGIISTAIKREQSTPRATEAAIASMTTLNAAAADAGREAGVRCATDVTGFGLLGHLRSLLTPSRCAAVIESREIPLLPDVRALAEGGAIPGGTKRNLEAVAASVEFAKDLDEIDRTILADAQTSGGLLLCVPEGAVGGLIASLRQRGVTSAAVIGQVTAGVAGTIKVR